MLANPLGSALVTSVNYEWESAAGFDHVLLSFTMSRQAFAQSVWRQPSPIPICVMDNPYNWHAESLKPSEALDRHQDAQDSFDRHWALFEEDFCPALWSENLDEACRIWYFAAEIWLFLIQDEGADINCFGKHKVPRRGATLPFVQQPLARKPYGSNAGLLLAYPPQTRRPCRGLTKSMLMP